MIPLIIDPDPGVDDAMAILYPAADAELGLVRRTSGLGNLPSGPQSRNELFPAGRAGAAGRGQGTRHPKDCPVSNPGQRRSRTWARYT